MSRSGAPAISVTAPDVRVAIVAASWHEQVMDGLVEGAHRGLTAAGVTDITEVRVPGTFELPVACATLAGRFDALVALGVVIRGGTPHFEYVAGECTKGLAQVSMEYGVPVAFGVLTVDSIEQAIERSGTKAGNKGAEAALSALEMVSLLAQLEAK